MTDYLRWHVRNATRNHCGACLNWDGQVKSEEEWDLIARPPRHYGCGCYLELAYSVDDVVPASPPDEGSGGEGGLGPLDPKPDDVTPVNPPATPAPATPSAPNKPTAPPAKKKPKPEIRKIGKPR